jgi:nucleoside-diphosphate-sugar epimerase
MLEIAPMTDQPSAVIGVTGATGFIGKHLVHALRRDGANVKALSRRPQTTSSDDLPGALTWVSGALDDESSLRDFVDGCDAVIHLAGVIKALSRDEFLAQNAEGTRRLAMIAAEQPEPPRFIYVSSLAAREPRLSNYALSKREGEKALRPHAGKMSFSIIRPPAVYGPGDMETLRIFQLVARGLAIVPSTRAAKLSLLHVEDLVAAILNLLPLREDTGEPFEIDDNHPGGHDWAQLIGAAADALRITPKVIPIPPMALYLAGALGSAWGQLTQKATTLSWDKAPELLHPDWVSKGPTVPGWTPRWSLPDGFKNTVSWAISQGLLKSYS